MRKIDQLEAVYYRMKNWYQNTIGFSKMKWCNEEAYRWLQKNKEFKNKYQGQRCFIVGNGPSVKRQDLSLLKEEYVFTVNQSSRRADFAAMHTNFHFWTDSNLFVVDEKNPGDLAILDVMKGAATKDNDPICFFPLEQKAFVEKYQLDQSLQVRYLSIGLDWMYEGFQESLDLTKHIPTYGTVVQFCIVAAIYMGFEEIYLLGCDNTGIINTITSLMEQNDGANYGYDVSEEEKQRMERTAKRNGLEKDTRSYLYNIRDYRLLREYCDKRGIQLVNCSAQTVIDSVPRASYETIIKRNG